MSFFVFTVCTLVGLQTLPAFAYLDPGAGSFALQMLLAGALAVAATGRAYWYRLKAFIARVLGRSAPGADVRD